MPDVKRKVKIVTTQKINAAKPPAEGGLPFRDWNIEVYLVGDKGETLPATIFDKVTYHLHPSFDRRAKQIKKEPPFKLSEEGWGEFEMSLGMVPVGKGTEQFINHDLNFGKERYEVIHDMIFKNPKAEFFKALDDAGAGENGVKRGADGKRKKAGKDRNVDMEKLADGLQKLAEEDLLHVVQMIHDQKTSETYTKNDVEAGEFSVDLYTLPDGLVKQLWEFTVAKVSGPF